MWRAVLIGIFLGQTLPSGVLAGEVLRVSPVDSWEEIEARLTTDAGITEVVFAEGVYRGGLTIPSLVEGALPKQPLLIRPARGATVVLRGDRDLTGARPVEGMPGVYVVEHESSMRDPPKLWEPDARIRYLLAADLDAVGRFPASYVATGGMIYLHTSDGLLPADRRISISSEDFGLSIERAYVTVRDLEFRDFVARDKFGTAISVRADHVTIKRCSASNCSFGFVVSGDHGAVLDCDARDVGGGLYVTGDAARVEGCRLFKTRDAYMIPTHQQDDTGIQFYHPARGGVIRDNLAVGFATGILIKATAAAYRVEHNTLSGDGMRRGFVATTWYPEQVFELNVVDGFETAVQVPDSVEPGALRRNCYRPAGRFKIAASDTGSIVGDPAFVHASAGDYRLGADSRCRDLGDDGDPAGARSAASPREAEDRGRREWHVSPTGRDGADADPDDPVRTVQYAVDRAGPGDTILLHPGIYSEPIIVRHGGTKRRPLTIRDAEPGTAVLDMARAADVAIDIEDAPFVEIRDLEIRWYRKTGIRVTRSPHVTVAGCRIWNAPWRRMFPNGIAIEASESPGFTGHRNVLFRQEHGFLLVRSPGATITHNTCAANVFSAVTFVHSIPHSVCRNNSFAFQGNDAVVITAGSNDPGELESFDCDYNNYGTHLREEAGGDEVERILPRDIDRHLVRGPKAIIRLTSNGVMRRFVTMREWREFSGRDVHSIFADPLYRSTATRDFRLDPASPNVGAGEKGRTIGALEAAPSP